MSKPVNLNRLRKAKARADKKASADANAAKHGRTKAQRRVEDARAEQAHKRLDLQKLDE